MHLIALINYISHLNCFCSLAGYDENSVQTYAMLVGVVTSGEALGAMLGSPISGAVTEHLSFEWFTTIASFLNIAMVCY